MSTNATGPTPDEIDELARRAQAGDRDALESLLGAVRPRTLGICRGVLPYSGDAEDACQEALINVANKIGSWGGRGRFTTWLHVVAVNSARSTYRRLKNQATPTDLEDG
ncbi:MAG TPA: RNA polymerase sigma factor, partial [Nocardioides sp.]